ncbi:SRPBCC family protein [Caulobacter sp. LjRoot300]|uniref:SRPBCC family protein n=1 Tax=Caulobacter sp. LjRoot300 TaxID=3342321 RepID=UPI003ECD1EC8
MFEHAEPIATFLRQDDVIAVRIRRDFDAPPERLWTALTRPEDLVQWLAPGMIALELGGVVQLDFGDSGVVIDSLVTAFTPGKLLEYGWSGAGEAPRPLRWEIEPAGEGARLTLSLTLPATEDAGRAAAGWSAHLDMLAAALAEVPIRFPFARFQAACETYRKPVAIAEAAWALGATPAANAVPA